MFSNLLPKNNLLFSISYKDYAKSHFRKDFEKKYKGRQWEKTEISIFEDLSRLSMVNNTTQESSQIDELKHKDSYYVFKYDFRVAGTNESTKSSGNRVVGFIDTSAHKIEILIIYAKSDLPKNKGETAYIEDTLKENYPEIVSLFKPDANKWMCGGGFCYLEIRKNGRCVFPTEVRKTIKC